MPLPLGYGANSTLRGIRTLTREAVDFESTVYTVPPPGLFCARGESRTLTSLRTTASEAAASTVSPPKPFDRCTGRDSNPQLKLLALDQAALPFAHPCFLSCNLYALDGHLGTGVQIITVARQLGPSKGLSAAVGTKAIAHLRLVRRTSSHLLEQCKRRERDAYCGLHGPRGKNRTCRAR